MAKGQASRSKSNKPKLTPKQRKAKKQEKQEKQAKTRK